MVQVPERMRKSVEIWCKDGCESIVSTYDSAIARKYAERIPTGAEVHIPPLPPLPSLLLLEGPSLGVCTSAQVHVLDRRIRVPAARLVNGFQAPNPRSTVEPYKKCVCVWASAGKEGAQVRPPAR